MVDFARIRGFQNTVISAKTSCLVVNTKTEAGTKAGPQYTYFTSMERPQLEGQVAGPLVGVGPMAGSTGFWTNGWNIDQYAFPQDFWFCRTHLGMVGRKING
jgi:hypothetical protein